jgi:hypothetical protein
MAFIYYTELMEGRSVGVVRSRTQAMQFSFFLELMETIPMD